MASSKVEEASALIASVAAGDDLAFASIVRLHHEDLRRVCAVVAGDDGVAEDAVAAAWSIAWRKLGDLRDLDEAKDLGPAAWSSTSVRMTMHAEPSRAVGGKHTQPTR